MLFTGKHAEEMIISPNSHAIFTVLRRQEV
jgi:hypothetical protein